METIAIPKEEYRELKEAVLILELIEEVIHKPKLEEEILRLSEPSAKELWDNEYDEIWNTV